MASADDSPGRVPRLAALGVLVASVWLAVVEVGRVYQLGSTTDVVVAVAVTAVYLPLHLWHLRYGLRGERAPRSGATLAVMAVAHAAALLVIGPAWSFAVAALATSALVVLRPRWALAALVACACAPIAAAELHPGAPVIYSGPAAAGYLVISVVFRSVLQFAVVWLVAAVHQLDASRAAVAAAAAELERNRLEAEVRASLEQRAGSLADAAREARSALDKPGVAAPLLALDRVVALSRHALADLRRIVADARHPAPHEAAEALARTARDARSPVGRTLVVRQAWLVAAAVPVIVVAFMSLSYAGAFYDTEAATSLDRAVALPMLAVAVALMLSLSFDVARGRRPRYGVARWLAIVAVYAAGQALSDPIMTDLVWFVGAGALMVFSGRWSQVAVGLTAAWFVAWNTKLTLQFLPSISAYDFAWDLAYLSAISALTVLGLYASARLVPVVVKLEAARDELASQAARSERRRLSGDLHDVLGQRLTAISLKGDLASRLVARDRAAAAAELDDLLELALGQGDELAAVTRDEREVAFGAEATNAIALLESAGIVVDADFEVGDLDAQASTLLGWAVREGTTNVLRHATASDCSIRAWRDEGRVCLELSNDGAGGRATTGTGLAVLADRFAQHGGAANAEALPGGRFVLAVELPALEAVTA